MTIEKVECVECGRRRVCVVLQLCIPTGEDETQPHELVDSFLICRECLKEQGNIGDWMNDILRRKEKVQSQEPRK